MMSLPKNGAWCFVLLAVCTLQVLAQTAHAGSSASQRASSHSMPLEFHLGKPVIELAINGQGPYRFVVDTGASVTTFDRELIDELALSPTGKRRIGDPSNPEAYEVAEYHVGGVGVGGLELDGVSAVAMDLSALTGGGSAGLRGVLSVAALADFLVTLDFPNRQLRMSGGSLPEPDGATVLPLEDADPKVPTVRVRLGDEVLSLHLDTGSPGTITLPDRYAETLPLASKPVVVGTARLASRSLEIRSARMDGRATLGKHSLDNPQIDFIGLPVGNLGMGLMRDFVITLDQRHDRIRIVRGAPEVVDDSSREEAAVPVAMVVPAPERRKRYGIRLVPGSPNEIRLMGVEPGSPAESAGLRAGDIIFEINGTACSELSETQRAALFRTSPITVTLRRSGETLKIEMTLEE